MVVLARNGRLPPCAATLRAGVVAPFDGTRRTVRKFLTMAGGWEGRMIAIFPTVRPGLNA